MENNNENIVDLFQEEIEKNEERQKRKIEKFKKQEEKRKEKELKKLEKLEDKGFAKQLKMSRMAKYSSTNENKKLPISLIYKIFIIAILFITTTYFIYSLIAKQIPMFDSILFTLMILSFILSSTIQRKRERKITFIIASSFAIIWMLLHL